MSKLSDFIGLSLASLRQSGATLGQVPVWDGSAWKPSYLWDVSIPDIGDPVGGGFYFGDITIGGEEYALIIADKASETRLQWKTSDTRTEGAESTIDGLANSNAMNNASHPAAKYCRDYRGGGYDDWYLGARGEYEIARQNIPPEGETTPNAFKSGGTQALIINTGQRYWTSSHVTYNSPDILFTDFRLVAYQGVSQPTEINNVRPIRRIKK